MPVREFYDFRKKVFDALPNKTDLSFINPNFLGEKKAVLEDYHEFLQKRSLSYQGARGNLEARVIAVNFWSSLTGFSQDYNCALVTYGTKDSLNMFLTAFCLPGQKVFLLKPFYPAYLQIILAKNLRVTSEIAEADAFVFSVPHNPTGDFDWIFFNSLIECLSQKPNIPVFLDCVYAGLSPSTTKVCSALRVHCNNLFESYSLSKGFGIGSVRAGLVFAPKSGIDILADIRSRIDYGVSSLVEGFITVLLSKYHYLINKMKENMEHRAGIFKAFGLEQIIKSEAGIPFIWLEDQLIDRSFWERLAFNGFLTIWGGFYLAGNPKGLRVSLTAPEVQLARFCQLLLSEFNELKREVINI